MQNAIYKVKSPHNNNNNNKMFKKKYSKRISHAEQDIWKKNIKWIKKPFFYLSFNNEYIELK